MDSMKILYDSVKLGEKIGDLRSDKNWSQEELSKKFRECGVKFDKETIAKIENGSYKKEIGIKKLIALSQIFKVSIDDLLDNHIKEKETNKLFIAEQETGLQKDSIDKLKIYQNNAIKTRLLDKKLKLVEDINELDYLNNSNTHELEEIVFANEKKQNLYKTINKLKTNYREAIYLADIEELKYSEIGKILKKSQSSTKVLIHRARKELEKLIRKESEKYEG